MSKRGYISRYLLIIKKLKSKPFSSYEELKGYIENQLEYLQLADDTLNIGFSKRTLQRDIREISNIFNIDIEYSKSGGGYYISQNESENMNFQRMVEAFDMFNSLNLAQDLAPYIYFEKRKPLGTENLYGLLHAIKNSLQIRFCYQKFGDEEISNRNAEPYALKEFKNRWYIIAKDIQSKNIRTFALDRLTELEITGTKFEFPAVYDVDEHFRYCFGIINPDDQEPEEIILSFDPFQGKYIKTLPLHESQQVIIDTDEELQIRLKLFVTHDLIMELLTYGDTLKVIKPKSLADQLKEVHFEAYKQYLDNIKTN